MSAFNREVDEVHEEHEIGEPRRRDDAEAPRRRGFASEGPPESGGRGVAR